MKITSSAKKRKNESSYTLFSETAIDSFWEEWSPGKPNSIKWDIIHQKENDCECRSLPERSHYAIKRDKQEKKTLEH